MTDAVRVAAIDCGTNTIKLLVADLDANTGSEQERVREMRMVRLGQGVDRTGRLADEALERVFAAVDEYAAMISTHAVDEIRFCATSAARDASNAEVFADGVRGRLGVSPEVLSGRQEAQLSYDGATRGLVGQELAEPFLVVDIGGGSTELILGERHGHVLHAESMNVGSVRLTERHLGSDPPDRNQIAAAVGDIESAIEQADVPVRQAGTVVGVGGTITTVVAGTLDLATYDRKAIHHAVVPRDGVHATTRALLGMTKAERTALPYMHPGRADVIGAGALIFDRVLRHTTVGSILASEADILDGIAWSLVGAGG